MKLCSPEAPTEAAGPFKPVLRPETLRGLRVGLLDNTKPPADRVMTHLDKRLRERFPGMQSKTFVKRAASVPATPEMLATLKQECDVVITGFGD